MGHTKLFKYNKLKDTEKSPSHTSKCFDLFKKGQKKTYQSLEGGCLLNNKRQVFAKNETHIITNNLKSTPYHPVYSSNDKIHVTKNDFQQSNGKLYKFVKKILKRKLKTHKKDSKVPKVTKKSTKSLCANEQISVCDDAEKPLWYHESLSRQTTTKILEQRPSGSFVIRKSSKRNCFALSMAVQSSSNFSSSKSKVLHFLVLESNNGFKLKGSTKVFQSLKALVTHHSVMPETLPITLLLPKSDDVKEYYVKRINRKVEDYDSFEQLRKVLEEIDINENST